jgi:hypothetical protein
MTMVNQHMQAMVRTLGVIGCTARVAPRQDCVSLSGSAVLWSLAVATLVVQANPHMIPAQNGNTCPGSTSYAGAGYCKVL